MKNVVSKLTKQMKTFKLKSLLQNKYVLYILVLVSLLNILDLANKKDFNSVIVFVIVGFLVSFFNKNMIVILLCALIFTHVLKYVNKVVRKEGMENEKKNEEKENEDDEEAMNNKDSDKKDLTEEEETMAKKKETYDMLKKDFDEFQDIQKNILENMKEIDPLLEKAENFITKFEHYKKGK